MKTKQVGTYKVAFLEDENKFVRTCQTYIYDNKNDENFRFKLRSIGCDLGVEGLGMIFVHLPFDWFHINIWDGKEFIIDQRGRKRMEIDIKKKTTKLIRRFSYGVDTIAKDIEGGKAILSITMYLTDCDKVIHSYTVPGSDFYKMKQEDFDENEEYLYEYLTTGVKLVLEEKFPDWENETAYW